MNPLDKKIREIIDERSNFEFFLSDMLTLSVKKEANGNDLLSILSASDDLEPYNSYMIFLPISPYTSLKRLGEYIDQFDMQGSVINLSDQTTPKGLSTILKNSDQYNDESIFFNSLLSDYDPKSIIQSMFYDGWNTTIENFVSKYDLNLVEEIINILDIASYNELNFIDFSFSNTLNPKSDNYVSNEVGVTNKIFFDFFGWRIIEKESSELLTNLSEDIELFHMLEQEDRAEKLHFIYEKYNEIYNSAKKTREHIQKFIN